MITDPYKDKTLNEMKAIHALYMAFIESPNVRLDVRTGDTPNAIEEKKTITHTYGTRSYSYEQATNVFIIKDDWFDTVYMNGIPTVYYNGKLSPVLEAKELPVDKLRKDLQLPGTKLFSCTIPVAIPFKFERINNKWTRMGGGFDVEHRFITAQYLESGDVFAYAGLSPNRAGANLRKKLMTEMKRKMGL